MFEKQAKMNGATMANFALRILVLTTLMLTVSLVPRESKAGATFSSNPQGKLLLKGAIA